MKYAIFLLAFCAFQAVFADQFYLDLTNLHNRSLSKMNSIVEELRSAVEAKVNNAQARGINEGVNECWKEFNAILQYHLAGVSKCVECYHKATYNRDIEFAEKCYDFNIAALQSQAKLRRINAKRCIKRYDYEAQKKP